MGIKSKYSLILLNKISEAKEISYYELRKFFTERVANADNDELNRFNEELDGLEEVGAVRFEEGMIIYVG